jgi:hypothetical protein
MLLFLLLSKQLQMKVVIQRCNIMHTPICKTNLVRTVPGELVHTRKHFVIRHEELTV